MKKQIHSANNVLKDPLSDISRKDRRNLLVVCLIGISIKTAGIIPTQISALGINFQRPDQQMMFLLLASITVYFIISFILHSGTDFVNWRLLIIEDVKLSVYEKILSRELSKPTFLAARMMRDTTQELKDKVQAQVASEIQQRYKILYSIITPISIIKGIFEFIFPILLGVYAIILLLT